MTVDVDLKPDPEPPGLFEALAGALAKFGATTRPAIETATKAGDVDTGDLFTGVSGGVDKLLWLVEPHAQAGT